MKRAAGEPKAISLCIEGSLAPIRAMIRTR